MPEVDKIQEFRNLVQKRFVELATEMPPKSRRLLKELFDKMTDLVAAHEATGIHGKKS